jgi:hypothetical protein
MLDTSTLLKVLYVYKNKLYDRSVFSPVISPSVFSIGVVPLSQLQIEK